LCKVEKTEVRLKAEAVGANFVARCTIIQERAQRGLLCVICDYPRGVSVDIPR